MEASGSRSWGLGPALFWRRLLVQALTAWLLVRAVFLALALQARWADPAVLSVGAATLLISFVVAVVWLDLRRRNLDVLLPNLGVPVAFVLGLVAATGAAIEVVVYLVLGT